MDRTVEERRMITQRSIDVERFPNCTCLPPKKQFKVKLKIEKVRKGKPTSLSYGWSGVKARKYLSQRMWDKFLEWVEGQTCPVIRGRLGVYEHDVKRFADMVLEGKRTYWD